MRAPVCAHDNVELERSGEEKASRSGAVGWLDMALSWDGTIGRVGEAIIRAGLYEGATAHVLRPRSIATVNHAYNGTVNRRKRPRFERNKDKWRESCALKVFCW